jgi:hypothetical protein
MPQYFRGIVQVLVLAKGNDILPQRINPGFLKTVDN